MKLLQYIPEIRIQPQISLPKKDNIIKNKSGSLFKVIDIISGNFILKLGKKGDFECEITISEEQMINLLRNKDLIII